MLSQYTLIIKIISYLERKKNVNKLIFEVSIRNYSNIILIEIRDKTKIPIVTTSSEYSKEVYSLCNNTK